MNIIRVALAVIGILVAIFFALLPPTGFRSPVMTAQIGHSKLESTLALTPEQRAKSEAAFDAGQEAYGRFWHYTRNRDQIAGYTLIAFSLLILFPKQKK